MKAFFFLFLFSTLIVAQEYIIMEDENSEEILLVGTCTVEVFQDSNYAWWYNHEYNNYKVDTNTVLNFVKEISDKKIKIVLGTWCSDSKREVPRFIKILDSINFPSSQLEIIGVDRSKKGIANEVDDLDIEFVPTIIVYENDEEIGRIIESPYESLEIDLIEMF